MWMSLEPLQQQVRFAVVALGSSTGGPSALESIFSRFPKKLPIARATCSRLRVRFRGSSNLTLLECVDEVKRTLAAERLRSR